MRVYYSLLLAIAILIGSAYPVYAAELLPLPQSTQTPQKLAEFNAISVHGPIQLILDQTPDSANNFLQAENQATPINSFIKEGTLYLQRASNSGSNAVVRIGVSQLKQLIVEEGASVNASHFVTQSLAIEANTTGNIVLKGMVKLDQIISTGSGLIDIEWVDSSRLKIEASQNTQIRLAGVAGFVNMRLQDRSQFQGKYFRVDRIYIQTKDYSSAKLLVNDSLRAFAYDNSNIYYYKKPAELTETTVGSGNVLQLGWEH